MEDIKQEIADETEDEDIARLTEYMNTVKQAADRFGVKIPQDLDDDSSRRRNPNHAIAGQEMDFEGYQGPYGQESRKRYALNGTYGLFKYALKNKAKFEAYEEVEKRLLAFYKDMIQARYSFLRRGRDKFEQPSNPTFEKFENDHHDKWEQEEDPPPPTEPCVKVEVTSYIDSIRKGGDENKISGREDGVSVEPELIGFIRESERPLPKKQSQQESRPPFLHSPARTPDPHPPSADSEADLGHDSTVTEPVSAEKNLIPVSFKVNFRNRGQG